MASIVDDLLNLQSSLAAERAFWEDAWRDCVNLCMPTASHRYSMPGQSLAVSRVGYEQAPQAAQRSKELYDSSAVWACDRLTAGMESLITPRAQKWHSFALDDPFGREPNDLEEEWLDRLRDYHFNARYDPRSNFALANQKAIRSTVILGTGILYLEENMGRNNIDPVKVPFFYRHLPVIECYLGADAFDDVNQCIRLTDMTAAAAAAYFGAENVSERIRTAANDLKKQNDRYTFMQAVLPADMVNEKAKGVGSRPYASYWIEVETKHLIRASGFWTFPFSVMWWDQVDNSPYGQSAPMSILADIKMLQAMSKTALQAAQVMVKPPLATMAGLYNQRLNLNPGAINPGYVDEAGRPKALPIITGANPSLAESIMELKRAGIRESLYTNLFQILVQNPQQTATEALIRANEKGELLGPAGAKIEAGIAKAADREVDIIQRKGAFEVGSPLAPPSTVPGSDIGVTFTGPLARLRRMQELQGVESVLNVAGVVGQYDMSALDRIDSDDTLELVREIRGAPRKMFRNDEEVAAIRQQRAQQQEAMAAMQMTDAMAGAAGKATPAIKAMQEAQAAA